MAKYKKKRARQLRHDRFRDTTILLADRLAERVAGRGRQIVYVLAAIAIVSALAYGIIRWRQKHRDEAQQAMGRAIAIMKAEISSSPPPNSKDPVFTSQQERAQRAIAEFQKVAAKYGEPFRTEARYFIATNKLIADRPTAQTELRALAQGPAEIAILSKFALAQSLEPDGKFDEAAALYADIAGQNATIVTPETANLHLAMVYEKQGKKKEAADLLFAIADASRKAKDAEGKPGLESSAAREAVQKLLKVDPARHAQLPPPPPRPD